LNMGAFSDAVFIPDLREGIQIPQKGIASRVLQDDERLKIVLFGLAAGHEMSLHAASVPALLVFIDGEAILTLGEESLPVKAGAFTHMPANLKHAIVARTPVVMLLAMVK
jgi:quercetin dioxygenase-like cupin family protein